MTSSQTQLGLRTFIIQQRWLVYLKGGWVPLYPWGYSEGVEDIKWPSPFSPLFPSCFFSPSCIPPSRPFFYKTKDKELKGERQQMKAGFLSLHLAAKSLLHLVCRSLAEGGILEWVPWGSDQAVLTWTGYDLDNLFILSEPISSPIKWEQ